MGILDFFRKPKKDNNIKDNNIEKNKKNIPDKDISLSYSSGIGAQINFGNVIDYDGKHLQEVEVVYCNVNGKLELQNKYMEPHIGVDENGKNIYDTKQYFKSLVEKNRGLVKGFFEKNSVDSLKTNYIGTIGKDANGKYNRTLDYKFLDKYIKIKEAQKMQSEAENREKIENDKFRASLNAGVKSGYQNACDNKDYYSHNSLEDKKFERNGR